MQEVHANTPLRIVLIDLLGLDETSATYWDDVTLGAGDTSLRLATIRVWLARFPAATVQDWFLVGLEIEDAAAYLAAGYSPAQVDELLYYLYDVDRDGQLTYASTRREAAWRTCGLPPEEVLDRLARDEILPPNGSH